MSHLTRPECHIVAMLKKHSFSMNWIEGIMPLQLSSHIQSISWSVNQWPSWTVLRVASATKKSGILHNITFKILSMSHHCVTRVSDRLTDSYRRCSLSTSSCWRCWACCCCLPSCWTSSWCSAWPSGWSLAGQTPEDSFGTPDCGGGLNQIIFVLNFIF